MSKADVIHELYEQCKDLNFDETYQLMKNTKSKEEKDFICIITDFVLQQKQKKVISEKRF